MKLRFIPIAIAVFLPFTLTGQTEVLDTLKIRPAINDSLNLEFDKIISEFDNIYVNSLERMVSDTIIHQSEVKIKNIRFIPGQASFISWHGGGVIASGTTSTMPGLMGIENGAIGVAQQFGNFSVYGGGVVNKYGFFRGLHTQYGLTGQISYRISPNVSVIGFGSYYWGRPPMMANGMIMSPAVAGYFGVSTFGGLVDFKANDHFGVEVGAQAVQQIGTRRYEPEPIVTPYVNIGKKAKVHIGLPVGQILYGILRSRR